MTYPKALHKESEWPQGFGQLTRVCYLFPHLFENAYPGFGFVQSGIQYKSLDTVQNKWLTIRKFRNTTKEGENPPESITATAIKNASSAFPDNRIEFSIQG